MVIYIAVYIVAYYEFVCFANAFMKPAIQF